MCEYLAVSSKTCQQQDNACSYCRFGDVVSLWHMALYLYPQTAHEVNSVP